MTGEGGILGKATEAKEKTTRGKIIEQAKVEVFGKQTENLGSLTEKELKDILENYGTLSENNEISILDKILTTKEGKYDIEVREIYDGKLEKGKIKFNINLSSSLDDINANAFCFYEGEFVVDEGCTWKEFFVKEFSTKLWDEDDPYEHYGRWFEYNQKILMIWGGNMNTGLVGPTFLNSDGNMISSDAIIEGGVYVIGDSGWSYGDL